MTLSSVRAPKIGRRQDTPEPYAMESKEFLRSKLIGRHPNPLPLLALQSMCESPSAWCMSNTYARPPLLFLPRSSPLWDCRVPPTQQLWSDSLFRAAAGPVACHVCIPWVHGWSNSLSTSHLSTEVIVRTSHRLEDSRTSCSESNIMHQPRRTAFKNCLASHHSKCAEGFRAC